jgi:hypothetical protein
MLKSIAVVAGVVVVAIAIFLAYASTKPNIFRIERTTSIKAPPAVIFAYFNDFHRWGAWSPYEHRDPDMKRTYSGPESGVGSIYEWSGDRNIGSGRIEILEATPPSKIVIKLDFLTPFEAHNTGEFTMVPKGDATEVTWAMYGPATLMSKVMSTIINMDRMVGGDFETGLANLKAAAESQAVLAR